MTSYPNSEANVKVEPRVWEPDYLDILIKLFANKFVTGDPNQFLLRVSKRKFFYSVFTCIFAGWGFSDFALDGHLALFAHVVRLPWWLGR